MQILANNYYLVCRVVNKNKLKYLKG